MKAVRIGIVGIEMLEDALRNADEEDRAPLSDAHLGREIVRVIYGAYLSAEEGHVIELK